MICKQCGRNVPEEEMALSGYRRRDGKRSRRNICRKCYNLNKATSKALKEHDVKFLARAKPVYEMLNNIPFNIYSAFFGTPIVTQPAKDTIDDLMGSLTTTDVVESQPKHFIDMAGVSTEARLILEQFENDLSNTDIETAILHLYECSCDTNVIVDVPIDGQKYAVYQARTDLQYPENFLNEIYEVAENIFDETSCLLFGYEVYPKSSARWRNIYAQLMQVFQIKPIN